MARAYGKRQTKSRNGRIERREGRRVWLELPLPLAEVLSETETAVEQLAGEAGLLLMRAAIEAEVEQLAGPRYARLEQRRASRWGSQAGYVVFGGQKVRLARSRVRDPAGQELPLANYRAFQTDGRLQRAVAARLVLGLSTRNYEPAVQDFCRGYGIKKSSVSRHFVRASAQALRELVERPLGGLDLAVLILDGLTFAEQMLVVALGVDGTGHKQVLGLWQGASENAAVCRTLLEELIRRGLAPEQRYLFVLDGSKALRKAVRQLFGENTPIQRCLRHKRENVRQHLPQPHQARVDARLCAAYNLRSCAEAQRALENLARSLERLNPSAAASLREGLDETLTLHRLEIPEQLRQSLRTTNLIESCFSRTRHLTRNVKRWQGGDMVQRWAATMLLTAEKTFRRLKGYRAMPLLVQRLRGPRLEKLAA